MRSPNTATRPESGASHELGAQDITLGYRDRVVIEQLTMSITAGSITAIVGANASGKSTLLKALGRLIAPTNGKVMLDGTDIGSRSTKSTARVVGLLPQHPIAPEGITVADLVGRGRYPHQRLLSPWSRADYEALDAALHATNVADLAERRVDELSGGQRQRVWIAMALAQETPILLLDEPTSFLDVAHQMEVLDLLVDLNRLRATTIVVVLHELNLACRYADILVAMRAGHIHACGPPDEIVNTTLVQEVFGMDSQVITDPTTGGPFVIPMGRHRCSNPDTKHRSSNRSSDDHN
jgi:iron complex transport system ATP-binding protein